MGFVKSMDFLLVSCLVYVFHIVKLLILCSLQGSIDEQRWLLDPIGQNEQVILVLKIEDIVLGM